MTPLLVPEWMSMDGSVFFFFRLDSLDFNDPLLTFQEKHDIINDRWIVVCIHDMHLL